MKYPEYILQMVRKRFGLDENDTSKDERINAMEPNAVFYEVLNWNGLLGGWDCSILEWIRDIYGIDLSVISAKRRSEL